MSDSLKALMDRVALLEAQTFSTESTLPPLVENPDGLPPMIFPGGAMSYSDWAFGFSISGAVVTVNAGKVRQGIRAAVTASQTNITISADQTWIYVEYELGGAFGGGFDGWSATITSHLTEPQTNATTLKYPLHLWGVSAGIVSLSKILHLGDIVIPGVFA